MPGLAIIVVFIVAATASRRLLCRLSARIEVEKRRPVDLAGGAVRYTVVETEDDALIHVAHSTVFSNGVSVAPRSDKTM